MGSGQMADDRWAIEAGGRRSAGRATARRKTGPRWAAAAAAILLALPVGPATAQPTGNHGPAPKNHGPAPARAMPPVGPRPGHPGRYPAYRVPRYGGAWFQRPYPYHLDYYRMRYGGSYAPYFGNLYGPPVYYYYGAPYYAPPYAFAPYAGAYYW